jgi:hypothetical protein
MVNYIIIDHENDTSYTCGNYVDIIIDHENDTSYTCGNYVDIIIDHESDTPYTCGNYVDILPQVYGVSLSWSIIIST